MTHLVLTTKHLEVTSILQMRRRRHEGPEVCYPLHLVCETVPWGLAVVGVETLPDLSSPHSRGEKWQRLRDF